MNRKGDHQGMNLPLFMDKVYSQQVQIAEGGFGVIFAAYSKLRGRKVAIKKINIKQKRKTLQFSFIRNMTPIKRGEETGDSALNKKKRKREKVLHELDMWTKITALKCPYTMELLDSLDFGKQIWVIMDICTKGSLNDFAFDFLCKNDFHLSMGIIKEIVAGVFLALRELNKIGIVHRDIKPENILLTKDLVPKLTDFDMCRTFDVKTDKRAKLTVDYPTINDHKKALRSIEGTVAYMPPEAFVEGEQYNCTWDSFSLALTMLSTKFYKVPWEIGEYGTRLSDFKIMENYRDYFYLLSKKKEHFDWIEQDYLQNARMIPLILPFKYRTERWEVDRLYKKYSECFDKMKENNPDAVSEENLKEIEYIEECVEDAKNGLDPFKWTASRYEFSDFAQYLMRFYIDDRPTVSDACEHPYMIKCIQRWEKSTEMTALQLKYTIQEFVSSQKKLALEERENCF
eukprot:CAMPEP_0204829492 /NCGR_PEP_ID=MMETSP1346-20131115/7696_1 /ASSEMBLY_ACC=CAM_ASM_000771 /TAXON_ID=215587 /ORGANISM="Aplanochytrium stocchinoi, Strain GSBS06" /LENGTH=456 /DNA_ID=CAMNT_0051959339 /DNA_START=85 /DNA_END=1458 /DNA_ORIENTATION=+